MEGDHADGALGMGSLGRSNHVAAGSSSQLIAGSPKRPLAHPRRSQLGRYRSRYAPSPPPPSPSPSPIGPGMKALLALFEAPHTSAGTRWGFHRRSTVENLRRLTLVGGGAVPVTDLLLRERGDAGLCQSRLPHWDGDPPSAPERRRALARSRQAPGLRFGAASAPGRHPVAYLRTHWSSGG